MKQIEVSNDLGSSRRTLALVAVVFAISLVPALAAPRSQIFSDVASNVGLDFTHVNGATGQYYFPELAGSGVALFDYDSDGDLDVYLVQGQRLDPDGANSAGDDTPPSNQLFRNALSSTGRLMFRNVTEVAGVGDRGVGMGVAIGDYDNDGHPDIYVTNFGPNVFYRNNGDGTFTSITEKKGGGDARWSTSASFADYDRDGDLDLFTTNYVAFTVEDNKPCSGQTGRREYCGPMVYPPVVDRLYRNDAGQLTDVSSEAGIVNAFGSGLGVVSADFDGDLWPDFYVANDLRPNQLWMNHGDGSFDDEALFAGAAVNDFGMPEASMGVTAGDFDGDGDYDLFMTHLRNETNTIYLNLGKARFRDATDEFRLGVDSIPMTGFGSEWFDYDNDGFLDLFVANGAVVAVPALIGRDPHPYHEVNHLFHNVNGKRFEFVVNAFERTETSRGAAFGDIDNDGDVDVVVSNNGGPVRLLLNNVGNRRRWLSIELVGIRSNRDGVGARIAVDLDDGRTLWRRAHTDGSYLSANDRRVHFGAGEHKQATSVKVEWPSGLCEVWVDIELNRQLRLLEGGGRPISEAGGCPDR